MKIYRKEDFTLRTHDYTLSPEQSDGIHDKLNSLVLQAPMDSGIEMDLYYKDGVFSGKLSVFSGGKSFYATGEHSSAILLMRDMHKKMKKQLMRWKKSRSRDEITGVIRLNSLHPDSFKKAG